MMKSVLFTVYMTLIIISYMINPYIGFLFTSILLVICWLNKSKTFTEKLIFSLIISAPLYSTSILGDKINHLFSFSLIFINLFSLYTVFNILRKKCKFPLKEFIVFLVLLILLSITNIILENDKTIGIFRMIQVLMLLVPTILAFNQREYIASQITAKSIDVSYKMIDSTVFATAVSILFQYVMYTNFALEYGNIYFYAHRVLYNGLFSPVSIITIFLAVGVILNYNSIFKKFNIFNIFKILLYLFALLITTSRTGIIGVISVCGLITLFEIVRKLRNSNIKKGIKIAIFVVTPIIFFTFISVYLFLFLALGRKELSNIFSANGRFESYIYGLKKIFANLKRFVFGYGLNIENYNDGQLPHNFILETQLEMGFASMVIIGYYITKMIAFLKNSQMKYIIWNIFICCMMVTGLHANSIYFIFFIISILFEIAEVNKLESIEIVKSHETIKKHKNKKQTFKSLDETEYIDYSDEYSMPSLVINSENNLDENIKEDNIFKKIWKKIIPYIYENEKEKVKNIESNPSDNINSFESDTLFGDKEIIDINDYIDIDNKNLNDSVSLLLSKMPIKEETTLSEKEKTDEESNELLKILEEPTEINNKTIKSIINDKEHIPFEEKVIESGLTPLIDVISNNNIKRDSMFKNKTLNERPFISDKTEIKENEKEINELTKLIEDINSKQKALKIDNVFKNKKVNEQNVKPEINENKNELTLLIESLVKKENTSKIHDMFKDKKVNERIEKENKTNEFATLIESFIESNSKVDSIFENKTVNEILHEEEFENNNILNNSVNIEKESPIETNEFIENNIEEVEESTSTHSIENDIDDIYNKVLLEESNKSNEEYINNNAYNEDKVIDKKEEPLIENIKFSIIVPVYNAINSLKNTIVSLVNQTYKNIEIILVDDGSNDGSGRLCNYLCELDNRIKVFHQMNSGVSVARNKGLENATGDYVTFCDSDDTYDENLIENYKRKLDENHYYQIVIGYKKIYIKNDKQVRYMEIVPNGEEVTYAELQGKYTELCKQDVMYSTCNKLYNNKILKRNNIKFNEEFKNGEDTLFNVTYLSFMEYDDKILFDNSCLYNYYIYLNRHSLSKNCDLNYFKSIGKVDTEINKLLGKMGIFSINRDFIEEERVKKVYNGLYACANSRSYKEFRKIIRKLRLIEFNELKKDYIMSSKNNYLKVTFRVINVGNIKTIYNYFKILNFINKRKYK